MEITEEEGTGIRGEGNNEKMRQEKMTVKKKGVKEKEREKVVSCCQFLLQYKESLRPPAPDAG